MGHFIRILNQNQDTLHMPATKCKRLIAWVLAEKSLGSRLGTEPHSTYEVRISEPSCLHSHKLKPLYKEYYWQI